MTNEQLGILIRGYVLRLDDLDALRIQMLDDVHILAGEKAQ